MIGVRITSILSTMSELSSDYNESMRIMGGLSGALTVMLEFVEKRVQSGNRIDEAALKNLMDTLEAIDAKIKEVRILMGKTWLGFHYGKWYIWGAPVVGRCFGRAGATKIIKDLTDLEGDLNGDIKFLELQMTANAVQSLSTLSSGREMLGSLFRNRDALNFWLSNFDDSPSVGISEAASVLEDAVLERHPEFPRYSLSSLCRLLLSKSSRSVRTVDARSLAEAMGPHDFFAWIGAGLGSGETAGVIYPGHGGGVTCMCSASSFLATAGEDCVIKLFIARATLVMVSVFTGHGAEVTCMDMTSSLLVSGSLDNTVRAWLTNGQEEPVWVHCADYPVGSVGCTDRTVVYSSATPDCNTFVIDAATGQSLHRMHGHIGGIAGLVCIPSMDIAVVAGSDRQLSAWSIAGGECLFTVPAPVSMRISKVAASPSGTVAVLAGRSVTFLPVSAKACGPGRSRGTVEVSDEGEDLVDASFLGASATLLVLASSKSRDRVVAVDSRRARVLGSQDLGTGGGATCLRVHGDLVFVGTSAGGSRCLSFSPPFVLAERSEVLPCPKGISVSLISSSVRRCASSAAGAVAVLHPSGKLLEDSEDGFRRISTLPMPGPSCVCSDGEGGWLVGYPCGTLYSLGGPNRETPESPCVARHKFDRAVHAVFGGGLSGEGPGVFVETRGGGARVFYQLVPGGVEKIASEAGDSEALASSALVSGGAYVVWPSVSDGLAVYSVSDKVRVRQPFRSSAGVDPVTQIVPCEEGFATLHGDMDLYHWLPPFSLPPAALASFPSPVTSVVIAGHGMDVHAGRGDGTVHLPGRSVATCHPPGPVTIVLAGGRACSVGSDGVVMRHPGLPLP